MVSNKSKWLNQGKALDDAGAEKSIVSPKQQTVRGWNFTEWGEEFPVDLPLERARGADFDALLMPGGVMNPDALRMQPPAVTFVKSFFDAGKPVAVICHGPCTIIEADSASRAQNCLVAFVKNRSSERWRGVAGRRGERNQLLGTTFVVSIPLA